MLAEGRIAFMGSTEKAIDYFKWYSTNKSSYMLNVIPVKVLFVGFAMFKFRTVLVEYRKRIVTFKCKLNTG